MEEYRDSRLEGERGLIKCMIFDVVCLNIDLVNIVLVYESYMI